MPPTGHIPSPRRIVAVAALAAGLAAAPAHAANPRPEPLWDAFPLRQAPAGTREEGSRPTTIHGTASSPVPGSGDQTGTVVLVLVLALGAAGAAAAVAGRRRRPEVVALAAPPFDEDPPEEWPAQPSRPPRRQRPPRAARNTERPDRRHPGRGGNVPPRGRRR